MTSSTVRPRPSSTPRRTIALRAYPSSWWQASSTVPGSSRDWAGKGPLLLGVRVVIAESFERIHRSNLVQMGVLPLQFANGEGAKELGLVGDETYDVSPVDLSAGLPASRIAHVRATRPSGEVVGFDCVVRVDTPTEGAFLSKGGILPYVLGNLC